MRSGAVAWLVCLLSAGPVLAQLSVAEIASLQSRGKNEGWTFVVRESEATQYPLEALCGTKVPDGWAEPAVREAGPITAADLPTTFDWRAYNGVTPIRSQGNCGSCWAFAAVGAVESAIRINLGIQTNLSEQWLISCTTAGTCNGGWHDSAFCFMTSNSVCKDSCNASGAVLETAFPYVASDAPCQCPYEHPYALRSHSYVTNTVNDIKQAIYNHGPVATTVYVNDAFHGYGGGVFNACEDKDLNHAVVLVGWDDSQSGGVWILRNSWGTSWGESGYMRITYGCSRIGGHTYRVGFDLPPPTDLSASEGFTDRIRLSWTGNVGSTGYEVWRGTSSSSAAASLIGATAAWAYEDLTAVAATTYFYWVKGKNQIETSAFSDPDSGWYISDCNDNGVPDPEDIANHTSTDCNANSLPDECDPDADGDGVTDDCDSCTDTDGDGFGDPGFLANTCFADNCPYAHNPGQEDADGDAVGDACDLCPGFDNRQDSDDDGVPDGCDVCPGTPAGTPASQYGCPFSKADFDLDGDVDQSDFGHLQACMSGQGSLQDDPNCQDARLDGDGDVDGTDVTSLRSCLSGSGVPAEPGCG